MSAPFELAGISLDCDDPESLTRFYLKLLGGHILWNNQESAGIRIPCGLTLIMQRVTRYVAPVWPGTSIVHFDLAADADLTVCRQRAEAAGATQQQRASLSLWHRRLLRTASATSARSTHIAPATYARLIVTFANSSKTAAAESRTTALIRIIFGHQVPFREFMSSVMMDDRHTGREGQQTFK